MALCRCRNCGKRYEEGKSRADYKGYCSQACLYEKAKKYGYIKPSKKTAWIERRTVYQILSSRKLLGSVFVDDL